MYLPLSIYLSIAATVDADAIEVVVADAVVFDSGNTFNTFLLYVVA
jgi:hypothetical protein